MDESKRLSEETGGGEERFKLLLDTLPHIAFAIFTGGQAEYYNHAFVAYHGIDPGPDKASRTALLHPDDRSTLVATREAAAAADRPYVVEARLLRHDGAFRWHRIHNTPILRDGRRIGYVGTAVDIHDAKLARETLELRVAERTVALRESEARYRLLYNRTPLALQSVDREARLIDVNDTWTELFGWPRDQALGRSPTDFMTPESAATYAARSWPEMLASAGQVHAVEYRFIAQDGRVFDGRLSARGEFDASGAFIRSWSAIEDITAEKRAERELRQAQRMEAVGQLTAGIAHDFNNLMTAILGNLELLLRKTELAPRSLRLIEAARTAASRGARLTSQLLAFSRQQRIAAESLDLNALIDGMRPMLQSTIGANIDILLELNPAVGPALADATQLELAVLNLAINARDAMAEGGKLTIRTAMCRRDPPTRPEQPEAGTYVTLSVADTGTGIPDRVRERIFEPFFTTKGPGKGSGLGLPHVLGVLKQLGGGLDVQSGAGQGTEFTLYLPLASAPPRSAARDSPAPIPPRPEQPIRIMVIDDDPAVRAVTAEMLRQAAHEVTEYGSGQDALAALAETGPDLLVVDVAMPGMNGVDMVARARALRPGISVLFITGYAEERLLPPQGGEQVLRKPFGSAELEARVASVTAAPLAIIGNPVS